MKNKKPLILLVAISLILFTTGCEKDDDAVVEFDELTQFLADNDRDLPDVLKSFGIKAATVAADPSAYFIMDIRKSDKYFTGTPDYEDGHIPGAHSVALADVVEYEEENNNGNLPVVVACYSGHDSGHAVAALRLAGVSEAQTLLWGMSSWHENFNIWKKLIGNKAKDYPGVWIDDDAATTLPSFDKTPELDTGSEDAATILDHQIENSVVDALNGISNTEVLSNPSAFDIYCYWSKADWDKYGYITGAYQVTPGNLTIETLEMLDPSATNVFYCWSGQTASVIAGWLNALGYDAKTLKFSANGMIYDDLESHKWSGSGNYAYETGS